MWRDLNPLKIPRLLLRIAKAVEEQNLLLRELHLALTGKPTTVGKTPTITRKTGTTTRKVTASDVWRRTDSGSSNPEAHARAHREASASNPLEPPK
jgi:hypothetical protein